MGCSETSPSTRGNATARSPGIAPGLGDVDVIAIARDIAAQGMDPRVTRHMPAFDAPFFQAGLAGYSDAAMRLIARQHGCPMCVTEALLDRTLLGGGRGFAKADLGDIAENVPGGDHDHPICGQIMGSTPDEMAIAALKMIEQGQRAAADYRELAYADKPELMSDAATEHLRLPGNIQVPKLNFDVQKLVDTAQHGTAKAECHELSHGQSFDAIDLNFACPVKKVKNKARGGHWLVEPEGAIDIIRAVREALPDEVPLTLKLRRSYDDTPEMTRNFARIVDAATEIGCAWITVHGRSVVQRYVGPSRWDLLRDIVRAHPDIPIFGSGDIWTAADIFRMLHYTGASAVSVARGCIGNPWIFRQAREMMAGNEPSKPTLAEQRAVLEEHFALALATNHAYRDTQKITGMQMRKFGIRFAEHHPDADVVRRAFIGVTSLDDWQRVLDEHYVSGCDSSVNQAV
ncbi:MAG: tRNA-dihydrouridine synthase family protein [Phycisphaeraceae bacterium]|nr:tRNA-dihydrouridine synthase family protein [Phycisphaerales bacterium]MCB9860037.1 tRNA-dihydrouridine synthase family protein [Phycisphaeraceae bacterium]